MLKAFVSIVVADPIIRSLFNNNNSYCYCPCTDWSLIIYALVIFLFFWLWQKWGKFIDQTEHLNVQNWLLVLAQVWNLENVSITICVFPSNWFYANLSGTNIIASVAFVTWFSANLNEILIFFGNLLYG